MSVISAPIPSFEMEHVKADLEGRDALRSATEGSGRVRKHVEFAPYASRFEYPEPHYAPPRNICGIRRRIFWAIIAFVILLNVGTIAGLVVIVNRNKDGDLFSTGNKDESDNNGSGGDVNTTRNGNLGIGDVSAFKGLSLLPGTALAAVNWGNDTRVYYQNGDGKVIQSYCRGESCSPARNPIITDAKYFSPLESVGRVDSNSSIHIFYLSTDNTLREKILSSNSAGPTNGPLSAFNRRVHSNSDISATLSNGEIKLFYQDAASLSVQELLYTPTTGWTNGSQLLLAAPGSRIATALWKDNLRVYLVNGSSTLIEQKWVSPGGWSEGTNTDRELDKKSSLAALPPKDPSNPIVRMYSTNAYNELFTFTEKDPVSRKSVVGNVRDVADGIAAVQTLGGVVSLWFVERGGSLVRKTGDGETDMRGGDVRVVADSQDPEW